MGSRLKNETLSAVPPPILGRENDRKNREAIVKFLSKFLFSFLVHSKLQYSGDGFEARIGGRLFSLAKLQQELVSYRKCTLHTVG